MIDFFFEGITTHTFAGYDKEKEEGENERERRSREVKKKVSGA